ncbi:putative cytochrome P450 49a1 [Nymphon striatum]|nr:putative cytochrome P450 49a1 [Nymphon striatum]
MPVIDKASVVEGEDSESEEENICNKPVEIDLTQCIVVAGEASESDDSDEDVNKSDSEIQTEKVPQERDESLIIVKENIKKSPSQETNASLRKNLLESTFKPYDKNIDNLKEATQQLMKTQICIQETSNILKSLSNDLSTLEKKLDTMSTMFNNILSTFNRKCISNNAVVNPRPSYICRNNCSLFHEKSTQKSFDEIPGPPASNIFKFYLQYVPLLGGYDLNRVHEIAFKKQKMYGMIRKETIPKRFKAVFLYNPEDVEKVFRNEGRFPVRTGFAAMNQYRKTNSDKYHGCTGLFTMDKKEWYSIRSKTQSTMMRPKVIASYLPVLNDVANDMIILMKNKHKKNLQIDDLQNNLYRWALESVGVFALDKRFGCLDVNLKQASDSQTMINITNDTIASLTATEFGVPLWKYFPTKGWRQLVNSQTYLLNVTEQRIHDVRNTLSKKNPDDDLSFIENLVHQDTLSEGELLCFILDLFMAGIDTTAHSVAFLFYNLAKNPSIQEKLYMEIKSIVKNSDDEITVKDLENLKYLRACLKESMRITPTIMGTARILDEDLDVNDYLVPKGTLFILQSMVVGNLEANVKHPTKFIPERWLKDSPVDKMHNFANFPFGYGPRMCIGKRLAEQEIYLLICKVLLNFRICYDGEMGILTKVVNILDKPLNFEFICRNLDCTILVPANEICPSKSPSSGHKIDMLAKTLRLCKVVSVSKLLPFELFERSNYTVQVNEMSNPPTAVTHPVVTSGMTMINSVTKLTSTPMASAAVTSSNISGSISMEDQVLNKIRLQDLVKEVDQNEQLDEDVEDILLKITDDFIENVVSNSCNIAKHRKSNILEVKDVKLNLEHNWNMWIPGFGSDDIRPYKKAASTEAHKQRLALIRKTLKKY